MTRTGFFQRYLALLLAGGLLAMPGCTQAGEAVEESAVSIMEQLPPAPEEPVEESDAKDAEPEQGAAGEEAEVDRTHYLYRSGEQGEELLGSFELPDDIDWDANTGLMGPVDLEVRTHAADGSYAVLTVPCAYSREREQYGNRYFRLDLATCELLDYVPEGVWGERTGLYDAWADDEGIYPYPWWSREEDDVPLAYTWYDAHTLEAHDITLRFPAGLERGELYISGQRVSRNPDSGDWFYISASPSDDQLPSTWTSPELHCAVFDPEGEFVTTHALGLTHHNNQFRLAVEFVPWQDYLYFSSVQSESGSSSANRIAVMELDPYSGELREIAAYSFEEPVLPGRNWYQSSEQTNGLVLAVDEQGIWWREPMLYHTSQWTLHHISFDGQELIEPYWYEEMGWPVKPIGLIPGKGYYYILDAQLHAQREAEQTPPLENDG